MKTPVYRCEECGSDEGAEPVSICAKCVAAAAETAKRGSEVLEAIGYARAIQDVGALLDLNVNRMGKQLLERKMPKVYRREVHLVREALSNFREALVQGLHVDVAKKVRP